MSISNIAILCSAVLTKTGTTWQSSKVCLYKKNQPDSYYQIHDKLYIVFITEKNKYRVHVMYI